MARPTGGDWGGIAMAAVGLGHNVIAAGQQREMICGAIRRHRRAHPVLVPALWVWFSLHVFGVLPRWCDPLYWLGVASEWVAELARRMRR